MARRSESFSWFLALAAMYGVCVLWLLVIRSVPGSSADVFSGFGIVVILVSMLVPISAALTSLHELAHAVVGRAVGAQLFGVTIGRGRCLVAREIGSVRVEVRSTPIGGVTILGPTGKRWRDAAMVSAGVGVEALVIGAASLWHPTLPILILLRWLIIGVAACDVLLNLWPHTIVAGFGSAMPTDGAQLIALFTSSSGSVPSGRAPVTTEEARLAQSIHAGDVDEMVSLARQRLADDPDDTEMVELLGWLLLQDGEWREAYELLAGIVDADRATALLRNNTAWAAVMTFDPQLVQDADRLSEQSFAESPTDVAFANTRGAALTLCGRPDDGLGYLKLAEASPDLTREQRSYVVAFRALAEHQSGNLREAREHLTRSLALDERNPAALEVERRVRRSRSDADRRR